MTTYAPKTTVTTYAPKTETTVTTYAPKTTVTTYAPKTTVTTYAPKTTMTTYAHQNGSIVAPVYIPHIKYTAQVYSICSVKKIIQFCKTSNSKIKVLL